MLQKIKDFLFQFKRDRQSYADRLVCAKLLAKEGADFMAGLYKDGGVVTLTIESAGVSHCIRYEGSGHPISEWLYNLYCSERFKVYAEMHREANRTGSPVGGCLPEWWDDGLQKGPPAGLN